MSAPSTFARTINRQLGWFVRFEQYIVIFYFMTFQDPLLGLSHVFLTFRIPLWMFRDANSLRKFVLDCAPKQHFHVQVDAKRFDVSV